MDIQWGGPVISLSSPFELIPSPVLKSKDFFWCMHQTIYSNEGLRRLQPLNLGYGFIMCMTLSWLPMGWAIGRLWPMRLCHLQLPDVYLQIYQYICRHSCHGRLPWWPLHTEPWHQISEVLAWCRPVRNWAQNQPRALAANTYDGSIYKGESFVRQIKFQTFWEMVRPSLCKEALIRMWMQSWNVLSSSSTPNASSTTGRLAWTTWPCPESPLQFLTEDGKKWSGERTDMVDFYLQEITRDATAWSAGSLKQSRVLCPGQRLCTL